MSLDPEAIGAEIERILEDIRVGADRGTHARSQELVRLLMSLYGAGLSRMLDLIRTEQAGPQAILERFAGDGLIASLLALHELHPHSLDARVRRAIEALRPHFPPHLTLSVVTIAGDTVHLRAAAPGGPAATATLRASVERAIQELAPEIATIRIDGLDDRALIQIVRRSAGAGAPEAR